LASVQKICLLPRNNGCAPVWWAAAHHSLARTPMMTLSHGSGPSTGIQLVGVGLG